MTDTLSPRAAIEQVDRQIDAVRRALKARLHFNPGMSSYQWQEAWDRCPDLHFRTMALYRKRGQLQRLRDAQDHAEWMSQERKRLAAERSRLRKERSERKTCPTCGAQR